VTGDVLGGADGSGSVVRKQLLPEARLEDTGMAGIGGKLAMATQVTRRDGGVWTNSSMPGSSTWSQYWRDANGWPGAFPSPTYSWPMCWGLWIGLAGYPRLSQLWRARHSPPLLREGTCRPDGAFCCGRLINGEAKGRLKKL
jgi:hypothetical protein